MKKLFTAILLLALPLTAQGQTKSHHITKIKNLARQAAEKANGGLSHYRVTKAMYDNIPCWVSWGLQWRPGSSRVQRYYCDVIGGNPASVVVPTTKTVVAITITIDESDWNVRAIYNEKITNLPQPPEVNVAQGLVGDFIAEIGSILNRLSDFEKMMVTKYRNKLPGSFNELDNFHEKLSLIQDILKSYQIIDGNQNWELISDLKGELVNKVYEAELQWDRLTTKPYKDKFGGDEGSWIANEPLFMEINKDILDFLVKIEESDLTWL